MKKNINLEKIIYSIIIVVIIGLPLMNFCYYISNIYYKAYYSILMDEIYLLWIIIPLLIICYLFGIITKKYKFNFSDILIYFLIIFGIISTIFAVDINISIIGEINRNEGLLTLISYYLIFLNVKNIKNINYKQNIIKTIIYVGIFQTTYGILQSYTVLNFIQHFNIKYMAMGLVNNPNFFGSYEVMLLFIVLPLYLLKEEKKHLFLTLYFYIGLCLSCSTGPFLAFIVSFIFFIIIFRKNIKLKNIIGLIIILTSLFFLVDVTLKYIQENIYFYFINSNYNISEELNGLKEAYNNGTFGNGRLTIWKNSIPVLKKYWFVGAGIDNFKLVYPQNSSIIIDKAHNIYLQMIITNGIFAFITYCILCLIIFIKGFKYKKEFYISLFMGFVAYCVQAFANISVIDVAPYFFIILGLLYSNDKKTK